MLGIEGGEGPGGGGGGGKAAMTSRCARWWKKGYGEGGGQEPYSVCADDHDLDKGLWCDEDAAAECTGHGTARASELTCCRAPWPPAHHGASTGIDHSACIRSELILLD